MPVLAIVLLLALIPLAFILKVFLWLWLFNAMDRRN
jgi:hypothetical protein